MKSCQVARLLAYVTGLVNQELLLQVEYLGPAVIVSVNFGDRDRALITVVPHTTSLSGSPFEIAARVPFLKPGAFLVQGVTTFPTVRALHRLGTLSQQAFDDVFRGLLRWLGRFPEN